LRRPEMTTTTTDIDVLEAQFELDETVARWRDLKERRLRVQRELGRLKAEEDELAARLLEVVATGPKETAHGVLGVQYREVEYRPREACRKVYPQLVLVK
jgi:hypothetical protein